MYVTIKDVAREAGVSISTISKVINHCPTISDATVKHVRDVMNNLGYVPNARAASFARRNTRNIVFLTKLEKDEAYANPHMFDIMCGVQHSLAEKEHSMMFIDISREPDADAFIDRIMMQKSADGMIIHGVALNRNIASLLVRRQFPHVIIGLPNFESPICWIDTNHVLGGQLAAEHLLRCGYQTIAFIGGRNTDQISLRRQNGYIIALNEHGISINENYICYTDSTKENTFYIANNLLQKADRPRAIICENNTIALGALKAIHEVGLSIPDEIALIIFDKYPYSQIMEPEPTIININVYDLGREAGKIILRKIKNPSLQVQSYTTLPVLIKGQTT